MVKDKVLAAVLVICEKDPSFLNRIISCGVAAIQENVRKSREKSSDMEALAITAFGLLSREVNLSNETIKHFEDLAISKLEKHDFKTGFEWKWAVKVKEE